MVRRSHNSAIDARHVGGLDLADQLIESRDISGAEKQLQSISPDTLVPEDQGRYLHYQAICFYFRGDYDPSLERITEALELYAQHKPDSVHMGDALFWRGALEVAQGYLGRAKQSLLEAVAYGRIHKQRVLEARALDRLGYAYDQLGEHKASDDCHWGAYSIFDDLGDHQKKRAVLCNLLDNFVRSGRLREATELGREYPAQPADLKNNISNARQLNMALLHTLLGDVDRARELLSGCQHKLADWKREQILYHQVEGRVCLREDKTSEALSSFKTAIDLAGYESDFTSGLLRWQAECHLLLGNLPEAEALSKMALARAKQQNDRCIEAVSKRVIAEVALRRGDTSKARLLYDEAITSLAGINSLYELAVVRKRAALSGLYHDDQVAHWLQDVKEYSDHQGILSELN